MSNKLIEELSNLTLKQKYLKKELDIIWYNKEKREKTFAKIKETKKEIEYVKFKLELERKMRNANNNSR